MNCLGSIPDYRKNR